MLRSRLWTSYQTLSQRTITTGTKVAFNNENKQEQSDKTNEYQSSNNSFNPPRLPLTQQFTHQVTNQVPPLEYIDLYKSDLVLLEFLNKENKGQIKDMGVELGTFHWFEEGQLANRYTPSLHQFDRYGQRIDEVNFHPAYHDLMKVGMRYGVHSVAWEPLAGSKNNFNPHGHLQHAAGLYILTQVEAGVCCPLSMTHAGYPILHRYLHNTNKKLADSFPVDRILSRKYDKRCIPANAKSGLTIGMALTEKQGGSDVRTNTTKAYCDSPEEKRYILIGHKWFCSAPMSDGFLVLAQIQNNDNVNQPSSHSVPSCFFVPRWLPNGERNPFHIQRLKDKLGNRSNASSELEFNNTQGWLLGKEHDGIKVIIDMINGTRLDSAISSAALMRQALVQATWHARHRKAFGRLLIDQPLMKQVLVDLLLESEAATTLVMHLATLYDSTYNNILSNNTKEINALARIASALAKFWICKRTPETTYEALECLGGAGFVEESILPRIYREAPVNSIWEGSGNVICLDILRSLKKSPEVLHAYLSFMNQTKGSNKYLDAALENIEKKLLKQNLPTHMLERHARTLATQLALCLQAGLLVRRLPQTVSNAFCSSRLGPDRGSIFGDLPMDIDTDALLKRLPF
ncbi:unnamed protein product [Rotaria magnacalcarata]|uniref:DNA alkylation response protein n=1 Tax=Rotaria magnacalcarata TaxID=392030 RepID=A0A816LVZ2_9BILA|nr:unnamed protein product [Rotaria magnacalcarata]CAF3927771.1 unnamed protein product [Rotaria magnacalcarata]